MGFNPLGTNDGVTVAKFEPYSRRVLRRRRAAWLRRNAVVVTVVVLGLGIILGFSTFVIVATMTGALRWYLLGAVHAGITATDLHLVH